MTHLGSSNATWQDFPSTGTLITALTLENIETAIDLLVDRPVFAARQGTNQVLTVSGFTALTFDATGTETIDTHNAHSPTTNPTRWVCPRDGIYLPAGMVTTLNSTATRRACVIYKNGVSVDETQVVLTPSNNLDQGIASKLHPISCVVGDYLETKAFVNAAATTSAVNTSFSVTLLRGP